MNLVFEKILNGTHENFIECPDLNRSTIRRFTPSPVALSMINTKAKPALSNTSLAKNLEISTDIPDGSFIIPSGVAHSPDFWCGNTDKHYTGHQNKSVFAWLNNDYLKALKANKAYLLLDQSHEGYQVPWLWDWFHENCNQYGISPSRIIYVTGNLNCTDQYNEWARHKSVSTKMLTVPYTHFESVMGVTAYNYDKTQVPMQRSLDRLPTFIDHIIYKRSHAVKTFNVLQKRVRSHRIWFFKLLNDNNLINDNIVSMNAFDAHQSFVEGKAISDLDGRMLSQLTPMMPPVNPIRGSLDDFSSSDCGDYLNTFNEQIMLDTWCSVVSESLFSDADTDSTCFISEKTFKPIACHHPFMILGGKGSLKRLRDMGYRTFSPFIDETYDTLPTFERMNAIVAEMKRINAMSENEKVKWFIGMREILEHNRQVLYRNTFYELNPVYKLIEEYTNV